MARRRAQVGPGPGPARRPVLGCPLGQRRRSVPSGPARGRRTSNRPGGPRDGVVDARRRGGRAATGWRRRPARSPSPGPSGCRSTARWCPNPAAAVEVRSPFAGTLRADPDADWPAPGRWVRSGQMLGWIDLRVQAQERLTLEDNLNTARLTKQGAERVVALQRERVGPDRVGLAVADRPRPAARRRQGPARRGRDPSWRSPRRPSSSGKRRWRRSIGPATGETSTYSQPLTAPGRRRGRRSWRRLAGHGDRGRRPGGIGWSTSAGRSCGSSCRPACWRRVRPARSGCSGDRRRRTRIAADPGHAPERWRRSRSAPLRGSTPPRSSSATGTSPATPKSALGDGRTAPASSGGRGSRSRRADAPRRIGRPRPSPVPAGAVLVHQGRSLVYVRVGPGTYERREVRPLGRDGDSWVLAASAGPRPRRAWSPARSSSAAAPRCSSPRSSAATMDAD